MSKTIAVDDELYEQLAVLARPFLDKEPADVIRRLVDKEVKRRNSAGDLAVVSTASGRTEGVLARAPRERGAVVELDGNVIQADSVPDLCAKVMQFMHARGHWKKVLELAPYKTSPQRYLYSRTPKHPNGNDFFVGIKCRDVYVEAHKNYKTSIKQLARFAEKCGVTLTYRGT